MPTSKHKKRKHPLTTGKLINSFRKIHRITAVYLVVIVLIVAVTGILLGWKKHSGGLILAKNYQGTSADFGSWLPMDSLYKNACLIHDSLFTKTPLKLDRIDVRKEDGMVKFIFNDGFWGIQLDGVTGRLLHVERRRADIIEKIHDGSIIDYFLQTNGVFKLIFSTLSGISLLIFIITGFWLFHGPRRLKKLKQQRALKIQLRKQNALDRKKLSETEQN
jgi:hypothetical protein